MKRIHADPEQIMANLRNLMKEAEEVLARGCERMSEEQVEALRSRMRLGVARMRDAYEDAGERMKELYTDMEDKISDYCDALEDKIRDRLRTTDQSVRNHPYRTAAVAFAAGILAGAFFASKR